MRVIAALIVSVLVAGGSTADESVAVSTVPKVTAARQSCWERPVDAPVIDGFRPPECRWCPGNRGIEFGSGVGDLVQSPVSGRVTFDNMVAGTRYLSVSVGIGGARLVVTIGGLSADTPQRAPGDRIARGDLVGRAAGAVHLGVRLRGEYVDPGRWLDGVPRAPVLVPVDGRPRRSAVPRSSCS